MFQLKYSSFYLLLVLLSCAQDKTKESIKIKYPLKYDSSKNRLDSSKQRSISVPLSMYNEPYRLEITNDEPNKVNGQFTMLMLMKNNKSVFIRQVSINSFPHRLKKDLSYDSTALEVEYKFVRSNRLHFLAKFHKINSEVFDTVRFAVYYQTKKTGDIDFW